MIGVRIFIPTDTQIMKEIYLRGVFQKLLTDNVITIFFTAYSSDIKQILCDEDVNKYIFGFCNKKQTKLDNTIKHFFNYLEFENELPRGIKTLIINKKCIDVSINNNTVIMYYDYNAMKLSEKLSVSSSHEDVFSRLHEIIQKEQETKRPNHIRNYAANIQKPSLLSSTMFGQHLWNYISLILWLSSNSQFKRKISIKKWNLIFAILTDLLLGYLVLQLLNQDKEYLSAQLMGILEKLVTYLHSLLKWLMGAPAGLKLNNAFNKMLGKYFSYHVQLWWLFLDVSGEKLSVILQIYHYLGYLGFTFQAAIISDMLCIATFHSYCIYVYAARLFNIQISGLTALLRLFVGRKYNPLRGGIDSCEYSNQELFVGTVAFTILLFLLPTTAMYYIVFTMFRLLSLSIQYFLSKVIYILQTLPLCVTYLWLVGSPKVAGNLSIEVMHNEDKQPLVLRVKLLKKSYSNLIKNSKPPVEAQNPIEWTNFVSKLLTGKQFT